MHPLLQKWDSVFKQIWVEIVKTVAEEQRNRESVDWQDVCKKIGHRYDMYYMSEIG